MEEYPGISLSVDDFGRKTLVKLPVGSTTSLYEVVVVGRASHKVSTLENTDRSGTPTLENTVDPGSIMCSKELFNNRFIKEL